MKQVLRKGFSEVVVEDIPAPILRKGSVLVAPLYSLISSGTESADLHTEGIVHEILERPSQLRALTDVAAAYGVVPTIREALGKFQDRVVIGYSGAGAIIEKDPAIMDLERGDMVAYGGQGSGHGEILCIPRNLAVRLPQGQSCREGAFATLGAIAMNGTRAAEIQIGDSVAVIGLGLVGQLVAQLVRVGGGRAIGIDLLTGRVELARRLYLDSGIVAGGGSEVESVKSLTGGVGVDCAIVCAKSKSAAPVEQAVQMLRDRGRLVIVGAVPLNFPWGPMYAKEIRVTMARAYGPGSYDPIYEIQGVDYPIAYVRWTENRNMDEFLKLVAEGRIAVAPLVTHEFPLDQAPDAYRQVVSVPNDTLAVLLRYEQVSMQSRFNPESQTVLLPQPKSKPGVGFGVALVGASNIARWAHIPSIRSNPATYIRSVCAARGAAAKAFAARFNAAVATTDLEQVLVDPEVKLVVVTTRHSEHVSAVTRALCAGKHVFVEKPMAATLEGCRQILEAEHKSNGLLCVGFNRRYAPVYRQTKKLLKARPGPVLLQMTMNAPWVVNNTWIHALEEGGGVLVGEGVHFFDLFCWLTDEEPVEISAVGLGGQAPEILARNNVVVTVKLSRGSVGCLTYSTQGHASGAQERLEIRAGGRTIIAEDMKRLTVQGKLFGGVRRLTPDRGYGELYDDFVKAIMTGSPSPVPAADGARATVLALKALDSLRTGHGVPVSCDEYRVV
jgi:predicted dehydrogenase/threonine dehydrogenase-like Zn-dependent dehydrogenase